MEQNMQESIINKNYINNLKNVGKYSQEVINLVEEDIEYGLTAEQTQLYLKKNIKFPQMKAISRCLRKGADEAFVKLLEKYDMSGNQMQVVIEFWEKGVSFDTIENVIKSGEKPAMMHKTFEAILEKEKQAKETTGVSQDYVKELEKKLSDTEAILNGEQDKLNKANATVARLREQNEEKKKEMERMQKRIETLEDKILEKAPEKTSEKAEVPVNAEAGNIPQSYQMPVSDTSSGVISNVLVEKSTGKGNQRAYTGLLGKLGFMKKSRSDIVKLLASGDLVPAQLVQIKSAIEKGLTESQLVELINNNVAAEKMKEIIDIAVLENSMVY